ncbi:MAG: HEAT repeat domain-containing protein [Nitrospirae bacterium]|nr:HEAT repeat domain-containing protein [Nitrospirota bacterium]
MSEPQNKKEDTQPSPPQRVEHEVPLDMRLLTEAVIELNISRKNVGIYPPGHIQIANSIERAYQLLQKMFEIRNEMTLGVAKDTLLIGKDYLDQKNPVYRDFALSMSQQGIASVTFLSGLEKDELVRFHGILTIKPEGIRASGGINQVIAGAVIPHIRIQSIDYSSFHVTEEQEIFKATARAGGGEESGGHLWQDFVTHLSAGTLAGPGLGVSVKDAEQIDPAELARLLNERKLDASAAIESYDQIISTYVRGTAEKKQITQEQSKTLANMNALLKDLHPELRKQFLSVAFKNISPRAGSPAEAEAVIGGFTDDMVIEMLGQASAEGREISPTLAGLVGKLAHAHTEGSSGSQQGNSKQPAKGFVAPVFQPEHMQKLFDREKYEEYVTDDYQSMLKKLSETSQATVEQFSLTEHLQSLEDENLDYQIGRALLAFLEENIDEEDYKEFAKKIVAIIPQFLETGNFEMLWDILETLRRHSTDKPIQGIREIAAESRKFFIEPEFIAKALSAFDRWMREKGQAASGLIQALGPETIPGLMDIFSNDETVGGRRVLFNLLCLFGEPAVREAEKRLRDPRAHTVRNLLLLIGRAGTAASIPQIKPLLRHQDPMVRIEALGTLLKFKDPGAISLLRSAIHDKDPDFAYKAVVLAGQYRIGDVTEDVLSKIKRVILFETDYVENEELIRVLGNIGDARAVPELEKLAGTTWSLYPSSLMHMKEAIYASLARYPRDTIAGLLRIGEKLNNDTIRRTCSQLREKQ